MCENMFLSPAGQPQVAIKYQPVPAGKVGKQNCGGQGSNLATVENKRRNKLFFSKFKVPAGHITLK